VSYDNWLIIEVASEPSNDVLGTWLAELLVSERGVSSSAAARFVAELQQLGRDAAELLEHTRSAICGAGR
jgi:hypothetical protein